MKRKLLGCIVCAGLGLFVAVERSRAQQNMPNLNNPFYRPAVSPYLNMARPGNTAINYYGLVKPQIDFANQIQTLQQNQGKVMPQFGIPQEEDNMMAASSITGHSTTFSNHFHFFGQGVNTRATGGQQLTPPAVKKH